MDPFNLWPGLGSSSSIAGPSVGQQDTNSNPQATSNNMLNMMMMQFPSQALPAFTALPTAAPQQPQPPPAAPAQATVRAASATITSAAAAASAQEPDQGTHNQRETCYVKSGEEGDEGTRKRPRKQHVKSEDDWEPEPSQWNVLSEDENEKEDTKTSSLKFANFVGRLKANKSKKKEAVAHSSTSEESNNESHESLSDDDFQKKINKKGGKGKGKEKPRGTQKTPYKRELTATVEAQRAEIKMLKRKIKSLEVENLSLKIELKTKTQKINEGDAEIIVISDSDSEDKNILKGMPMSFKWNENDRTLERGKKNSDKKDAPEFDWEHEPESTWAIPDDDFGHLSPKRVPEDLPLVKPGTVNVVKDLKVPCKACKLEEAAYRITDCNHLGLCDSCQVFLKNSYSRCPGCGATHIIFVEKVFF